MQKHVIKQLLLLCINAYLYTQMYLISCVLQFHFELYYLVNKDILFALILVYKFKHFQNVYVPLSRLYFRNVIRKRHCLPCSFLLAPIPTTLYDVLPVKLFFQSVGITFVVLDFTSPQLLDSDKITKLRSLNKMRKK